MKTTYQYFCFFWIACFDTIPQKKTYKLYIANPLKLLCPSSASASAVSINENRPINQRTSLDLGGSIPSSIPISRFSQNNHSEAFRRRHSSKIRALTPTAHHFNHENLRELPQVKLKIMTLHLRKAGIYPDQSHFSIVQHPSDVNLKCSYLTVHSQATQVVQSCMAPRVHRPPLNPVAS
ncbi:hypothetical protein H4Q26_002389 [Puccinia striiformis f. sp. tritici PST-130]|nr:hypothetical protein H4Q26_002389 [Puccinia striiformis f. sp. tritici PST-130]